MILQALNQYYERLLQKADRDVPLFGFSVQKISFCVVLERDGRLHAFEPVVSEVVRGRPLPQQLVVPGQSKPTGSGVNPCFLWDNATYMLGQVPEDRQTEWARERFEAFRGHHLAAEREIDDPAFSAVCRFLEHWDPEALGNHPELSEMARNFGAFRLRGEQGYVHERPAVSDWWRRQAATPGEGQAGTCLVTGDTAALANIHEPRIKGVLGSQSTGATLVSFNLDAFESYGKSQSYNAPVSRRAAFQYATALNRLLSDDRRKVQVADATTVFWTEKPAPAENVFPSIFAMTPRPSEADEDAVTLRRVHAFLDRLRRGKADDLTDLLGELDTRFYVLGLAPNASRISVRYWLTGTVRQLAKHLARHVRDLEIVGLDDRPPTVQELLRETAPPKNGYPDPDKIPRILTGGLVRSILTSRPYPAAFYAAILRRIRAESFAVPTKRKDWRSAMVRRAAAIKTYLIRNFGKEIPVSLNPDHPEPAYHLGRWFALLEKIQKDALGENLNATIKDRFFTAASSTPSAVFPRLIRLSQHHLNRIENVGLRVTRDKQVQEAAGRLDRFPRRLSMEEQGLFCLGYYHQTQALYARKSDSETSETPRKESE